MLIGYARVPEADGTQSLDLQTDALTEAGIGLKVLTGQGAATDTTTPAGQLAPSSPPWPSTNAR